MKINEEGRDSVADTFFGLGRSAMTPLWRLSGISIELLAPSSSSTVLKATQLFAFIVLSPLIGLTIGMGLVFGHLFHAIGSVCATKPFSFAKGNAQPTADKEAFTLFQQNCCLTVGGFARLFGGLELPDAERVKLIAEEIKTQDADLVCLQEVSDVQSAYVLIHMLSDSYAEFYYNIGNTPWVLQNNSGLFIASKQRITHPQFHDFSSILGGEMMVNKGFFLFVANGMRIVNTHLSPSKNDFSPTPQEETARREEEALIQEKAPDLVCGDMNQTCPFGMTTAVEGAFCKTDYLISKHWKGAVKPEYEKGVALDHCVNFSQRSLDTKAVYLVQSQGSSSDHPALLTTIQ